MTGRGTLGGFEMGQGTLGEVQDGSGEPWGGPGRFKGPLGKSRSFRTGRGTLGEVWDGSGDSPGGPDLPEGPRPVVGDLRGYPGQVGSGRVGGPSWRSKTGQGTLLEV